MRAPRYDRDPAQIDFAGAQRSAVQAMQARDAQGRGGLGPKVAQKPLDVGLFDPARDQMELFSPETAT